MLFVVSGWFRPIDICILGMIIFSYLTDFSYFPLKYFFRKLLGTVKTVKNKTIYFVWYCKYKIIKIIIDNVLVNNSKGITKISKINKNKF
jgi:hypothetical protein